jgi:hypothetical protein
MVRNERVARVRLLAMPGEPTVVSSLIGCRHVALALTCLGSLARHSADPVRFRLHDDGTLSGADVERLMAALPVESVVSRVDADARVLEHLGAFAACRRLRVANALGLKLFDTTLLASAELSYCDTDVLFLGPFRGLFHRRDGGVPIFLRDRQNAYCLRSWKYATSSRLVAVRDLNSGIIRCSPARLDLELIEWYLQRFPGCLAHVWVEQTCWALLAARTESHAVLPEQIALADAAGATRPAVAVHLASPVRGLLPHYLALPPSAVGPVEVATTPFRRCHAWDLARDELRRALR